MIDVAQESSERKQRNVSFTGVKLDWDAALAYDPRLKNADFRIGFVLMQYANEQAADPFFVWPSEETIAHEAGRMGTRHARRSVKRLIATKWVRCRRIRKGGKTHNVYTLLFDNVQAMLDDMTLERLARKGRRRSESRPEQDSGVPFEQDSVVLLTPLRNTSTKRRVSESQRYTSESELAQAKKESTDREVNKRVRLRLMKACPF